MAGMSNAHWHGRSLHPSSKASNNTANDKMSHSECRGLQCRPDNDKHHGQPHRPAAAQLLTRKVIHCGCQERRGESIKGSR